MGSGESSVTDLQFLCRLGAQWLLFHGGPNITWKNWYPERKWEFVTFTAWDEGNMCQWAIQVSASNYSLILYVQHLHTLLYYSEIPIGRWNHASWFRQLSQMILNFKVKTFLFSFMLRKTFTHQVLVYTGKENRILGFISFMLVEQKMLIIVYSISR